MVLRPSVIRACALGLMFAAPGYQKFRAEAAILRVGNPLRWNSAVPHLDYVRNHGVRQFINQYSSLKDVQTPNFKWGDELEYGIFRRLEGSENFDLSLRADELRVDLIEAEKEKWKHLGPGFDWQPEYGSWMVEIVPNAPFGGYVNDLLQLENSHRMRRQRLHCALLPDEIAPSLSNFPMLGVKGDYSHSKNVGGPIANSVFVDDAVINPHPRMGALTANIRARRERNVKVSMPVAEEFGGGTVDGDAMAFGMGCTCLQVTMQCKDEHESRYLHDQWVALSPLFLALSASTPFFNGRLVSSDTRWEAISQAVDCRTVAETDGSADPDGSYANCHHVDTLPDDHPKRRPGLYKSGVAKLTKSRYSSASLFIGKASDATEEEALSALNDLDPNYNCEAYHELVESGIDSSLAAHVAHMFVRDPLVIFDDAIEQVDDDSETDHFDNIQSTNWRSVRWKLPSADIKRDKSAPGWRLEMRTLEMQMSDFENAAYIIFTILLSRALIAKGLNFYMPISMVEKNFERSKIGNACLNQKFFMRNESVSSNCMNIPSMDRISTFEMTLNQIFNGDELMNFKGLIPVVREYLDDLHTDMATKDKLETYLILLEKRARGDLPTTAQWLRRQLEQHPSYRNDGMIPPAAANSIMQVAEEIGMGQRQAPELYGTDKIVEQITPRCSDGIYLDTKFEGISTKGLCCSGSPRKTTKGKPRSHYIPTSQCSSSMSEVTGNTGNTSTPKLCKTKA